MHPTTASAAAERHARGQLDDIGIFSLISDPCFADTFAEHVPSYRNRLYTPARTLAMFVSQVLSDDRSCQRVVNEHVARCAARDELVPSSSTGAYSDARQRLPTRLVRALGERVAHVARHRCGALDDTAPVLLIDGTGVSMPDTADNQAEFPQSASQAPGCGFPQARMTALVCATSGAVVDSVVGAARGKGSGESAALRAMTGDAAPGSVILGDAIYEHYPTWATLARAGCFGVFELNGSRALPHTIPKRITIERGKRPEWMTRQEHAALPTSIKLRVVRSRREGCADKILITSLLDTGTYPARQIRALYDRRWDVELDFRSFKDTLGAGVLGCCSPEMVRKELAVHLLGYNLIRLLMCEAAAAAELEPRQMSFRHAQQLWGAWVRQGAPLDERGWQLLLSRIAQRRVRNRPGRREPRAIKRRPKPRSLLNLPRRWARTVCHRYERKGR